MTDFQTTNNVRDRLIEYKKKAMISHNHLLESNNKIKGSTAVHGKILLVTQFSKIYEF